MKRHALILTVASLAVLLTGCQNPDGTQNNTGSGALIGGAMGAVTGAAIGGRRNGAEDAALGMAAGAVAGGLMGLAVDRDQEARLKAQAPQTYVRVDQGQPLSVADVKALARAGINEDVIINQIRASHTVYHLSAADIVDLRDSGVTNNVINYMISTPSLVGDVPPPAVIQQAPPAPPAETVVMVSPGPDYLWVGGEYSWNGIGWVWMGGHWGHRPYGHAVWMGGRSWHDGRGWHNEHGHWR
jgi:outer membrane lipoprotein SlyB